MRLLRVARFAAKLGFSIERRTLQPIARMAPLLGNVPGSRLFDEMVKLLQTGHAIASLQTLRQHGLIAGIFPILEAATAEPVDPVRRRFVELALEDTDRRVADGRAVAPSFLLACLLWHDVQARWKALREAGQPAFPALQDAVQAVFDARIGDVSGRGRLAGDMREIWQMQPRFERRTVASAAALIEQPRFRAGYDFLRLRADVGEVPNELADWWEDFSLGTDEEREALLQELKSSQTRRVPGPRALAPTAPDSRPPATAPAPEASASQDEAPARKRRRRRRRPGLSANPPPSESP